MIVTIPHNIAHQPDPALASINIFFGEISEHNLEIIKDYLMPYKFLQC